MNKRKNIEAALAALGITNEAELAAAIRNMKPVNLSIMAGTMRQERKAS